MAALQQQTTNLTTYFLQLLLLLGLIGYLTYFLGLLGWLYPLTALVALVVIISYLIRGLIFISPVVSWSSQEKLWLSLLIFFVFLHGLGVFVPEVGFDALWYHLPQAQVYSTTGKIAPIPELYYSTTPRLGDMFFTLAWFSHSLVAVKATIFLFSLLFILGVFLIARHFLSRLWSLIAAIIVYSLPLVAWLSSSAYVDLIRATFATGVVLLLLSWRQKHFSSFSVGILLGFVLATKLLSLTVLPAYLIFSWAITRRWKTVSLILVTALLVSFPWFLDNWIHTGSPVYPLLTNWKLADQLNFAGAQSLSAWFITRLKQLPWLFVELTYQVDSLLSPLIFISFPLLAWFWKQIWSSASSLILFSSTYLLIWWFTPPPESRYLLGALPVLIILTLIALAKFSRRFATNKLIITIILISISLNSLIRIGASVKYLPYLLGHQNQTAYLQQFFDGNIDDKLIKFYQGYWQQYQYHHP